MKKRFFIMVLSFILVISNLNAANVLARIDVDDSYLVEWQGVDGEKEQEIVIGELVRYDSPKNRMLSQWSAYGTKTQAGIEIRNAMINREPSVNIKFGTDEFASGASLTQEDVDEMMNSIFEVVYEVTDDSHGGDFLERCVGGYTVPEGAGRYSYSQSTQEYYFDITLNITYYTTKEQEEILDKAVDDKISEFGFTSTTTDYEKISEVYDFICDNVVYDTTNPDSYDLKYTAYAAMMNGTSVCQGYATLFYKFMKELDIPVRYISGLVDGGRHGWNIVRIGEEFYNIDSTWDAPRKAAGIDYRYFLVGDNNFTDHIRSDVFMTEEFNSIYPISLTDYDDGSEDVTTGNTESTSQTESTTQTESTVNNESTSQTLTTENNESTSQTLTTENTETTSQTVSTEESTSQVETTTHEPTIEETTTKTIATNKPTTQTTTAAIVSTTETEERTTQKQNIGTILLPTKIAATPKRASLKSIRNIKGKKIKLQIKKADTVGGYEIQYSLKRNFKSAKKKTTKNLSYTIKKLKKKKTYYVRVRAYNISGNTKKYGAWSKTKAIKVKK